MLATGIDFSNQHALVLGLGVSGLAMARWCIEHGARVTVLDTRTDAPGLAELKACCPKVNFVAKEFPWPASEAMAEALEQRFGAVTMVLRSPGLNPADTASVCGHYEQQGRWVTGELGLFEQALKALASPDEATSKAKILGITGTNGKTTVTSLCMHLLKRVGIDAVAAGNIGPSMLDALRGRLEADLLPQVWVLELSSFQLHANGLTATASTVLNISEDHLDWHKSMAEYVAAKAKVFCEGGLAVLNRDDAAVMGINALQVVVAAATRHKPAVHRLRNHVSFGSDVPARAGDFGLETVNGMVWLVRALAGSEAPKRKRGADSSQAVEMQRLMPADALRIRGHHNALNALAALSLCTAVDAPLAGMLYGLREYSGEAHRCSLVATIGDVQYIDDSKGTNVGATIAAIQSLGKDLNAQGKLLVILGGVGKGQNFAPLATALRSHARAVLIMGQDASSITAALNEQWQISDHPRLQQVQSMQEAVAQAKALAEPGDCVLLSPACASFDMFSGYAHRGQMFCDAVQAIASDVGAFA